MRLATYILLPYVVCDQSWLFATPALAFLSLFTKKFFLNTSARKLGLYSRSDLDFFNSFSDICTDIIVTSSRKYRSVNYVS